ncbi:MAG: GNAT family N-acetyltransferase [Roseibium sp.]
MNRVEMMDSLTGLNAALKAGAIKLQPTGTDPKVLLHADNPEGTPRLSFVRMKGAHATAIAVIVITEPLDNLPVIHIGCAVREDQRGKGLGRHVLTVALEDFRTSMATKGLTDYWIESLVEADNAASVAMTAKVLGIEPEEVTDDETGEPSFRFLKRVSSV